MQHTTALTSPFPLQAALSQLVFYAQMAVIAVMLLGDKLFEFLAVAPPELYQQVKEKRFAIIMACWFLGNMVHNSLTATGAFEVFYDGSQVSAGIRLLNLVKRLIAQVDWYSTCTLPCEFAAMSTVAQGRHLESALWIRRLAYALASNANIMLMSWTLHPWQA